MRFVLIILSIVLFVSCEKGMKFAKNPEGEIKAGKGIFSYKYEPLEDRPIKVHYVISEGDITNLPVIFVFPGVNRDADNYILPWVEIAKKNSCMVFAIEFPEKYYSDDEYITGNIMDKAGRLNNRSEWTFSLIDPLFQYIKTRTNNKATKFDIFGHSAGAQFAHRFILFNSSANVDRVISANAGWYTMPLFDASFPYGLKNTQLKVDDVKIACKVKLTIHLGEKDTNPNDASLRKTPEAMAQGAYRFARGKYFFEKSSEMALKNNYDFVWKLRTVPNVGHDQVAMAKDAANIIFNE